MEENATAVTEKDAGEGYCHCYVHTRSWAKGTDSALVDAYGYTYWQISWQWQGPPSTPPGGPLGWYIAAYGHVTARGDNDAGDDGTATSVADAPSGAWIARNGANFSGSAWAHGSVSDEDFAEGEYVVNWPALQNDDPSSWEQANGSFDFSVGWNLIDWGEDNVAEGTSQVVVLAGAACDGMTLAHAESEGSEEWEALATSYSEATAWVNAGWD